MKACWGKLAQKPVAQYPGINLTKRPGRLAMQVAALREILLQSVPAPGSFAMRSLCKCRHTPSNSLVIMAVRLRQVFRLGQGAFSASTPHVPLPGLVQWFLEHFPGKLSLQNRALTFTPGWLYGGGSAPESHRIPYSPSPFSTITPIKHRLFCG